MTRPPISPLRCWISGSAGARFTDPNSTGVSTRLLFSSNDKFPAYQ